MSRCRDCIHDGCCDGLPYCGGLRWESAYTECDQCGREFPREDAITDVAGHAFCCDECAVAWEADNEEEEGGEG